MEMIGHWNNGKMIEEYLFWDNQVFMKQIGLAKQMQVELDRTCQI
jgi:hypothetical protein